jgi:hypothetical protein
MFSQFNPTGTSISASIFRYGKTAFGYSTLPTATAFGNYSSMFNANTFFQNSIGIGDNVGYNNSLYGLGINKSVQILTATNNAYLSIANAVVAEGVFAAPNCNFCYSNFASAGDVVLKGDTAGSFIIGNEFNGNIKFETGQQNSTTKVQMMINNLGNIGIGTGSSPIAATDKLAVNGLIHTKEVKVDLVGWPDYVFEKEYNLPTLQEVEKYIATNGHLANVPSAKDVEINGLLLGDMNKKLLQKVEELTLYIIAQNKTNEKQSQEIEDLKVLVKSLVEKNK